MAISKDVICDGCDGHGGPKEAIEDCSDCGGTVRFAVSFKCVCYALFLSLGCSCPNSPNGTDDTADASSVP